MRLCLVACLAATAGVAVRADQADAPPATTQVDLENTWWEVARMIGDGAPWSECAARLEADLAATGKSQFASRCENLLASVRLNLVPQASPSGPAVPGQVDAWIAALSEARVSPSLLLRPLQVVQPEGQLAWTILAQRALPGPSTSAFQLFAEGRSAMPTLIAALDDLRATRSTVSDRARAAEPIVPRVSDVSLALIEAISLCRFHLKPMGYNVSNAEPMLFSEWTPTRRASQIAAVRDWWAATRDLSADEAIQRHLTQTETGRGQQFEMLDALIALNRSDVALSFLATRYRQGRLLDYEMAQRMLRAGSREPLDFVQEILRNCEPVQEEMVRLIADFGEIDDFKLLRDAVLKPCLVTQPLNITMVVNQMLTTDRALSIPIFVAALERRADAPLDGDPAATSNVVAAHLMRAAERIQLLSGKDFGFQENRSVAMLNRGFEDIRQWWAREGKSAYDYDQSRPHAPGGIR